MGLPVPVTTGFECDDVQLGQEITLLSAQINVANYRLLKLIADFDVRRAYGRRLRGDVWQCVAAHIFQESGRLKVSMHC
jgi:hypothetical protein